MDGLRAERVRPTVTECSRNRLNTLQAWRRDILKWYPKLHERAYFVPPVYMKRINYDVTHIAEQPVAVPKAAVKTAAKQSREIDEGNEMEDREQQRILHCLKKFCEKRTKTSGSDDTTNGIEGTEREGGEVMFVLSQLKFSSYLGEPCFAAAARNFPRPVDLRKQKQDRGDFDILIVHRHYGLLTAEVKSVGSLFTGRPEDRATEEQTLVRRLNKIVKQLRRSGDVLRHLTSDIHSQLRVTKTLMLPNVSAAQLQPVLRDNPQIKQELCSCFDIPDSDDPLALCLTSECLSDRIEFWKVTDDVMKRLDQWWGALMTAKGRDPVMTHKVYENLVARFAGPATTVEVFCPTAVGNARSVVRTEGEGVSETAARFADFVLHQQQISILNSGEKLVYLTGPPGTGKTVMLMLQAERWLHDGRDVLVVSMYNESIAAALFMFHSLQAKLPSLKHKIHFHTYGESVDDLVAMAKDGHLYIIVDELDGGRFKAFSEKLSKRVRNLHLWAARIYHSEIPDNFTEFSLAVPLRSPGTVIREIKATDFVSNKSQVRDYDPNAYPHTDGPLVREVRHNGPRHPDDVMPRNCKACGAELASVLKELHVGDASQQSSVSGSPDPLQYRDVFLLCHDGFHDTSGIITGLRQSGIPVKVLSDEEVNAQGEVMKQVVTMEGPDRVIAACAQYLFGLERKIVAWVQPTEPDTLMTHFDKLLSFSRSSGQLIAITKSCDSKPSMNAESLLKETDPEKKFDVRTLSSEDDVAELFLALGQAAITEDILREVDAILQFYVTGNGEERSAFVDLQQGDNAERVKRGVATSGKIAGVLRIREDDLRMLLRGDRLEAFKAFSEGRIHVTVNHSTSLLKSEQYWRHISALYKKMYGED